MNTKSISVIMLGASGAVGSESLNTLLKFDNIKRITILGRTPIPNISSDRIEIEQFKVDVFDPDSYTEHIKDHDVAICTFGVGEPSKISKEDFIKTDYKAVLDFASICKKSGVKHFEILSSIGADSKSRSHYLKVKGELIDDLQKLEFDRLSIFEPSMILTPFNRYGFSQALVLFIWPKLKPILAGGARKYRGIPVEVLGESFGKNILNTNTGFEILQRDEFYNVCKP